MDKKSFVTLQSLAPRAVFIAFVAPLDENRLHRESLATIEIIDTVEPSYIDYQSIQYTTIKLKISVSFTYQDFATTLERKYERIAIDRSWFVIEGTRSRLVARASN